MSSNSAISLIRTYIASQDDSAVQEAAWTALNELEAERDALAAAMPSEGADAAIGYAHMKAERDELRNTLGILRDMACRTPNKTLPDRIVSAIDAALAGEGKG